MPDLTLVLPPGPAGPGLDPGLLTGQLAPSSLAGYRRDVALYVRFCGAATPALASTSLARWRTHLAQQTALSPHTINRRLAAVKRLLQEAAAQGYVAVATAEAFHRVAGVQVNRPRFVALTVAVIFDPTVSELGSASSSFAACSGARARAFATSRS